jgi:excisionase family DNA binding protein
MERETRFYTIADVAELVQVRRRSVRRWISAGLLVAHRFGSIVRIAEPDLASFLSRHRERKSKKGK